MVSSVSGCSASWTGCIREPHSLGEICRRFVGRRGSFVFFFKAKGRSIHEVFNESREKASKDNFKAGATELLVALPLMLHLAKIFLATRLPDEVGCLQALAAVAHECQEAKFGRGDSHRLASLVSHHLDRFGRVYDVDMMKP